MWHERVILPEATASDIKVQKDWTGLEARGGLDYNRAVDHNPHFKFVNE